MKKLVRFIVRSSVGLFVGHHELKVGKGSLTVFVYHDISSSPAEFSRRYRLNVPPKLFERQLSFLKKNFCLVGPDQILKGDLPERSAMITFDDGFRSVFREALPLLENRQVPVVAFLNMHAVRGGLLWAALVTWLCARDDFRVYCRMKGVVGIKERPLFLQCRRALVEEFLDRQDRGVVEAQVREFMGEFASEDDLRSADGREILYGSHLFDHENPALMDDDGFEASYRKNEEALADYKSYRSMVSLPFGQPGSCFDKRHIALLSKLGAKKVFSSAGGINQDHSSFLLDRLEFTSEERTEPLMRLALSKAIKRRWAL